MIKDCFNACPLISVIVPAFNAEEYISECLDSLVGQTYSNIEIICVDDGSADATCQVVEKYQRKDTRIKLIRQPNQFAGAARNRGIMEAKGKYLLFVDADDFCKLDMLQQLVETAERKNTEILVFDLHKYDNKNKKVVSDSWAALQPQLFGSGVKAAADIRDNIFQFTTSGPVNKLFLREFIVKNDIWFQTIPRTNDLFFVYVSFTYADRIAVLEKKLEYYRVNNPCSLQSTNHKSPLAFLEALRALKDNLITRELYKLYEKSFMKLVISVSLYNLSAQKKADTFIEVFNAIKDITAEEMGINVPEPDNNLQRQWLTKAIQQDDGIVIYGAGMMAEMIVKYLIWIRHLDQKKIRIVVTGKNGSTDELCGIKIIEFKDWDSENDAPAVIIAINNKKIQEEIIEILHRKKLDNIMPIGFEEMLHLM